MSQPNYDIKTIRHIVETKFETKGEYESVENPLQITKKTPHHPQYSLKNKRYECGCGFKGDILNFTILPLDLSKVQKTKKQRPTQNPFKLEHIPRRYVRMVGTEIEVLYQ
jgi:hypothetical protein